MQPEKRSDIISVILKETSLILDPSLITLLNANPGDRIAIGYTDKEGKLVPIISVAPDTGNKLTKSNTVSFRGHQRNTLATFGTNFWAKEEDGVIYLEGDGIPVFTDVKKAAEAIVTKEIILDTNYDITKLSNYEF